MTSLSIFIAEGNQLSSRVCVCVCASFFISVLCGMQIRLFHIFLFFFSFCYFVFFFPLFFFEAFCVCVVVVRFFFRVATHVYVNILVFAR